MFIGKYYLHADDKGRLRIPLKFRYNMGTAGIYAMYSADGCLSLITAETANKMLEKFESMVTVAAGESLNNARILISSMCELSEDNQGRFTLMPEAKKYANISKDVVFVGLGNKIELWDVERWEAHCRGEKYDYLYKSNFESVNPELTF
ncbi:MAG: hypothetical protein K2M44_01530 [Clostridia bacterium]|nr:hypothetical protein [Clostridia bacterium]